MKDFYKSIKPGEKGREYLFTESIIELSLDFNEAVTIKNLILETLPQALI